MYTHIYIGWARAFEIRLYVVDAVDLADQKKFFYFLFFKKESITYTNCNVFYHLYREIYIFIWSFHIFCQKVSNVECV